MSARSRGGGSRGSGAMSTSSSSAGGGASSAFGGSSDLDLDFGPDPVRSGNSALPSAAEVLAAASVAPQRSYLTLSGLGGREEEEELDGAAVIEELAALADELPL